jgi:hypothetical protein
MRIFLNTDLVNKVHRYHVLADTSPKLSNLHVFGMNRVRVERGSIGEGRDEAGIVRTRQVQAVEPYRKTLHFRNDSRQVTKKFYVFLARKQFDVRPVFPDHNVCQHIQDRRLETQPHSQSNGSISARAPARTEEEVI